MTDRTRFVILMVTAPILAYTLVGGLLGRVVAREDTYRHLRVFEDVVSIVTESAAAAAPVLPAVSVAVAVRS